MKKIFNSIIHRFKEDSLSKKEEVRDRNIEYMELKEVRSAIVFWNANIPDIEDVFEKLNKLLGCRPMKVCFISDGAAGVVSGDAITIRNENLGFGGKILNEELVELLKNKFDVLIDLSMNSTPLCDYVLKSIQANCRIGMPKDGFQNDIIIDGVDNVNDFVLQLGVIWNKLKKY